MGRRVPLLREVRLRWRGGRPKGGKPDLELDIRDWLRRGQVAAQIRQLRKTVLRVLGENVFWYLQLTKLI